MTADRSGAPGYRGTLAPRNDRLARPWVAGVIAIFALVFVLAALGLPSRLFPEPTPAPFPTFPLPSPLTPTFTPEETPDLSPEVSPEPSPTG
jgi:hypothetical protein